MFKRKFYLSLYRGCDLPEHKVVISRPGSYHLLKAGVPSTALSTYPIRIRSHNTIKMLMLCKSEVCFFCICFLSSQTLLQNIIVLNFPGKQIHLYWKNYWAIEILAKVSLIEENLAASHTASFDSPLLLICLILYVHFQPSFLNLPIM